MSEFATELRLRRAVYGRTRNKPMRGFSGVLANSHELNNSITFRSGSGISYLVHHDDGLGGLASRSRMTAYAPNHEERRIGPNHSYHSVCFAKQSHGPPWRVAMFAAKRDPNLKNQCTIPFIDRRNSRYLKCIKF
jgi:hypothetical protein